MSGGPLRQVLTAFTDGARTVPEVMERTGLPADVVRAGVDHLVRTGRMELGALTGGCAGGGCGSCPQGSGGEPGCGTSGPVLVTLKVRGR
ncbi:hypothetical protein [Granulicoccus phenolivorans]|uniref:hypothetical protein n=1 Tax=Granulicoccus phenolivorans TaxID=266854 RepID=UPI0003FFE51D|nr:hypothetical protein [Granulicoccus phenolivorans]